MSRTLGRRLGGALVVAALALGTGVVLTLATGAAAAGEPTGAQPSGTRSIVPGALPRGSGGGARVEAGSGGRSRDMTLDGLPDITARNAQTGHLNVYPHSGTFDGLNTFPTVAPTSYGWFGMTWIGLAKVDGDAAPDVLARTSDGRLLAYPHTGSFANFPVVNPPVLLGYGWHINDLIYIDDWDGDGWEDIVARRAGTGDIYLYPHSGTFAGLSTYSAAIHVVTGAEFDVWEAMSDVTGDGVTDLIYADRGGVLGVFDLIAGQDHVLGYNWFVNDVLVMNDVTGDGFDDIVARRAGNGQLVVYPHAGSWNPSNPTATIQPPTLLGHGWFVNDIIT